MPSNKSSKKTGVVQLVVVGLLVVAAFAIGSMWTELRILKGEGGLVKKQTGQAATAEDKAQPEAAAEISEEIKKEIVSDAAFVKGNKDAKVTIVEFTDYQCPFCKRHFDQTADQLMKEYVDTGKVRYMLRDLPLSFHANAHVAAQAARCAGDQDQYETYHDKLFENQAVWAELSDSAAVFSGYATELGMNAGTFSSCLSSGKYKAAVDEDLALARKAGASGTPTFFINGKRLVGAQPFVAFKTMIDAELN